MAQHQGMTLRGRVIHDMDCQTSIRNISVINDHDATQLLESGLRDFGDAPAIRERFGCLPELQRTVLAWRLFGKLTQTQIADRMGLPRAFVFDLLSESLTAIRHGE